MPSCEKDPKPGEDPTINQITLGDYEGMDVVTYDNIEWEYFELNSDMSYYSKEFDVNGDGTNDFSIVSEVSVDPNSEDLNHPRYMYNISLHSSSNLKFHSQTVLNEVYYHVDSTIYPTDSIPLIYLDRRLTCNRLLESDPIQESYNLVVFVQHEKDDLLNLDDTFSTSCYTLYESNMEFPYILDPEATEATVYVSEVFAYEECYNFPIDEETFIGFKYVEDSRTRIGWIKLIIEHDANGDLIARPLETAIQKEYLE